MDCHPDQFTNGGSMLRSDNKYNYTLWLWLNCSSYRVRVGVIYAIVRWSSMHFYGSTLSLWWKLNDKSHSRSQKTSDSSKPSITLGSQEIYPSYNSMHSWDSRVSILSNDKALKIQNLNFEITTNSNTSRLYSQWLNSVIYWLINHCTDWFRTGVTSFGRQFEFHDVIYHKRHCNVENRRHNVVFTSTWRSKYT